MERRGFLKRHPALTALGIALLVAGSVLGARARGWLEPLELIAFDHYVDLMQGTPAHDSRIAMVEVQEQDIQNLGTYPISDRDFARVIRIVSEAGARAIGIDIYRDIPVPPGSEELDEAFISHPHAVILTQFADENGIGVRPPKILEGSGQVGFNNMVPDRDGIMRRGLLFMENPDDPEGAQGTSMSMLLAMIYLGADEIYPEADPDDPMAMKLGASSFRPLTDGFGGYASRVGFGEWLRALFSEDGYQAPPLGGFQYLLDYRGAPEAFPSVNLTDLLAGEFPPDLFRDRIVMFGVAAESLTDLFHIAFQPDDAQGVSISGAMLHGLMADQVIRYALGQAHPIGTTPQWLETGFVLVFSLLGAALMLWISSGWATAVLGLGGLGLLYFAGGDGLARGFWLPVVPPGLAWISTLTFVAAYSRSQERADRTELMNLFSRHVTKSVADDVWANRDAFLEGGRPKPVRLTATILFIDIRGYTGNAEKLDPAELMAWIDGFLGAMAQEVLDRGGMVEDYFGDGMMACYGIPIPAKDDEAIRHNAVAAVRSALGMKKALEVLNEEWVEEGRPAAGIRVGVATGVVVAGSMGSANRLKYGVVGDAVVTAQRLEALGLDRVEHDFERQPARILINGATNDLLDDSFVTESVGEFLVKGKNEPVTVYRVHGRTTTGAEIATD